MIQTLIDEFRGDYSFLSNLYLAAVVFEGERYPSAEHAYQAAKSTKLEDRRSIQRLSSPSQAKHQGRRLKLRPDWHDVKIDVMRTILRSKFQSAPLRRMLLETGDAKLIEGNSHGDRFWGCVLDVAEQ